MINLLIGILFLVAVFLGWLATEVPLPEGRQRGAFVLLLVAVGISILIAVQLQSVQIDLPR